MQIVIAKVVDDWQVVREGRHDLGERSDMVNVGKPVAAYWLKNAKDKDLEKAFDLAKREGYRVFTFPKGTRDSLEQAKAQIRSLTDERPVSGNQAFNRELRGTKTMEYRIANQAGELCATRQPTKVSETYSRYAMEEKPQ